MLSVEDFSYATCLRLLEQGYTHFIVKFRVERQEIGGSCNVITFEAVQGSKGKAGIPITQVMDLPEGIMTKYYVVQPTVNDEALKQA